MKKLCVILLILISPLLYSQSQGPLSGGTFSNVNITGGINWSNPGRSISSNNSYSISNNDLSNNGDYTDYLKVTNFGFSIPNGATIDGIIVEIEYFDNGSSNKARDNNVRIVKGGTIGTADKSNGINWPNNDPDSYTSYGSNIDLWNETWTDTDINSTTFGFAISGKRQGNGSGECFPAIDHIRITVYYTDVLPIELTYFISSEFNNTIILNWETSTETNNNYFLIERSKDAINFEEVIKIKGAGNSSTSNTYIAIDSVLGNSTILYYRLSQFDYDGKSEKFKIISINISDKNSNGIFVYPNPSNGFLNIETNVPGHRVIMSLYDLSGKIINRIEFNESIPQKCSYIMTINKDIRESFLIVEIDGAIFTQRIILN